MSVGSVNLVVIGLKMIRTILTLFVTLSLSSLSFGQDLRESVRAGNVDRLKELLESGSDVNKSYENRCTPIFFANDPAIVDILLSHGAKLDIRNAATIQSPIENAAENYYRDEKKRDTWKLIVEKLRKAGADYTIDTATYMNDVAFVKEQLAKDPSWVNKTRGAQSVPLRLAARTGRVEICKLLLENKADPNAFEEGAGHPIMVGAVKHPKIVELLIEHDANLKRRITWMGSRTGRWIIGDEGSALHYAVRSGNLESVKLLVNAGLDPSAADIEGQTVLHIAIRFSGLHRNRNDSSFHDIIRFLVDNDASLKLTDKSGKTPLELAEKNCPETVLQVLRNKQKQMGEAYRRAMFDNK